MNSAWVRDSRQKTAFFAVYWHPIRSQVLVIKKPRKERKKNIKLASPREVANEINLNPKNAPGLDLDG